MGYSPALTFLYWLSELSLFEILQVQCGNSKHTKKGGKAEARDFPYFVSYSCEAWCWQDGVYLVMTSLQGYFHLRNVLLESKPVL